MAALVLAVLLIAYRPDGGPPVRLGAFETEGQCTRAVADLYEKGMPENIYLSCEVRT